ncbi:MAG: hypothetical protein F6K54_09280 [Okeania sp. SIO3B5]|nr:hypothetical protein [Okeania sp. SIO3B5]
MNGINAYELRRYLQHAIANQKDLDLVIIGLDFFMFNKFRENSVNFSEHRLEKEHIFSEDFINVSFSLDATLASMETIVNSNKNQLDNSGYRVNRLLKFKGAINNAFERNFGMYKLSIQFLGELKIIVDLCQQNQIKLISYISPSHATQWEVIRISGEWSTFEEWKRQVVKIIPVFNFSGYNSITTEPIHNDMENYRDNSHYTPKVGNLILNRLLSYKEEEVPQDFGILINSENIESHLTKIRQDQEIWVKNNPDEVKLVKEIKQKYDASLIEKN